MPIEECPCGLRPTRTGKLTTGNIKLLVVSVSAQKVVALLCRVVDEQVRKLVSSIKLGPRWLDEVPTMIVLKDDVDRVKKERKQIQDKLRRMAKEHMDGLLPEDEYNRLLRLCELELESLVILEANAAEEEGKLILD